MTLDITHELFELAELVYVSELLRLVNSDDALVSDLIIWLGEL